MDPAYAQQPPPPPPGTTGETDDMQGMWQYLDSTLSTPNGVPSSGSPATGPAPPSSVPRGGAGGGGGAALMPAALAEGDAPPLTEDDNGMYNELGDVFNMFFNLDTDDNGGGAGPHGGGAAPNGGADHRVALSRHASGGSSSVNGGDGISPGLGAGYPSMSPATMLWLQSLGKSPSSESLSGLISPAGLFSAGGSSAGGLSGADGGGGGSANGMPRSPSMEIIDWKAYNETVGAAEKTTPKDAAPKWRVIPQHGPHADAAGMRPQATATTTSSGETADASASRGLFTRQLHNIKSTVVSIVGALGAGETASGTAQQQYQQQQQLYNQQQAYAQAHHQHQQQQQQLTGVVLPAEVQQQYEMVVQRMAEEKNKRKAIISPEYVQYSSQNATSSGGGVPEPVMPDPIKYEALEAGQYAAQVPDPTGKRPSKRSSHQAGDDGVPVSTSSSTSTTLEPVKEEAFPSGGPVRCKCTGKCRNARCACVKAGFVCGVHCKCVACANPFVPMEKEGIDIQKMVDDVCLMQFLSKVKDMQELLDSTVTYDCCGGSVQVKQTVENGFTCPTCNAHYTYSWCSNRLCHDQKKPRKHCSKCRRCGDHRNEHCDDCGHCYFAGVANSFSCSCKGGKTGSGSGSGVKSRSVIPNVSGVGGGDSLMSPNGKASTGSQGSDRQGDENSNPQAGGGNATNGSAGDQTMAAGLSSSETEKDDACKMQ